MNPLTALFGMRLYNSGCADHQLPDLVEEGESGVADLRRRDQPDIVKARTAG